MFPIVGKVKDGIYRVDGKEYNLPQHGLARVSEFELIEKSENKLVFELLYSEETLKIYPYKFSLIIWKNNSSIYSCLCLDIAYSNTLF